MSKKFALIENICFHFLQCISALVVGDRGVELLKLMEEWEPSDRNTEQDPCYQPSLGEGDWMRDQAVGIYRLLYL